MLYSKETSLEIIKQIQWNTWDCNYGAIWWQLAAANIF
jgi:hypothetical protein